jgi:predicted nuclease of predicted toxin-antitoxin system
MSDRIRFHLDENVDPAVAEGLQRRGVDVTTTQQAGLMHASDEKQLEFALSELRILVPTTKTS